MKRLSATAAALMVVCTLGLSGCAQDAEKPSNENASSSFGVSAEDDASAGKPAEGVLSYDASMTKEDWKINEAGQTYGPIPDNPLPEDFLGTIEESRAYYPDLIAAVNSDGIYGYITKDDYFGEMPSSPEEAAAGDYNHDLKGVTLYDSDGKTVLGHM